MADTTKLRDWQVPSQVSADSRKLDWLNSATEEGNAWLKSQRGTEDIKKALNILSGRMDQTIPQYRSQLQTNHLKRNVREIIGTLAKLRPLWGYSSDNKAFAGHADMMNKVTRAWYLESFADRSIKEALAYAAATCTGWIRPIYRRDMAGKGRGEIKLLSYGAPCILPVQLPSSGDFQSAYAVTILEEMPIFMAHAMFPRYQEQLRPTSSMYWYSNEIRLSSQGNIWRRIFGGWGRSTLNTTNLSDLMIPVRYTYVTDLSINTTDKMIPMGEPDTTWFYEVPYVGQRVPTRYDPSTGKPLEFKTADENDARIYPYRRLLISSESCVMYDGPAFDWHGRLPCIPFALDRWPWEPLGFSVIRDGYEIQKSIDELLRGVMDKLRALNDLPLGYDTNSVSSKEARQFDPMQPRARLGFDGSMSAAPFTPVVPPEVYKVGQEEFLGLDKLKEMMDEQHAIKDIQALAKARMASDDIEKLMEANGPIIEDMSRSMEPPMRELGDQVKYLILQYFDTARVMQYIGADNMTPETFDYDPFSLIPSHLPGEDPGTKEKPRDSAYSKNTRARIFADNLRFFITPNSLHELTQMTYKLGLIQLKKAQVKIDSQTLADAWGVPNYGVIDGATVQEKWKNEQESDLQFAMRMAVLQASLQQGGGENAAPDLMQMVNSLLNPPTPEGRPPTGQQGPALKTKTNGRSIITESEGGGKTV